MNSYEGSNTRFKIERKGVLEEYLFLDKIPEQLTGKYVLFDSYLSKERIIFYALHQRVVSSEISNILGVGGSGLIIPFQIEVKKRFLREPRNPALFANLGEER